MPDTFLAVIWAWAAFAMAWAALFSSNMRMLFCADTMEGKAMAARMSMMATLIRSSASVKPPYAVPSWPCLCRFLLLSGNRTSLFVVLYHSTYIAEECRNARPPMKTSTLDTPRNTETSAFHVKQSDTRARSRAGTRCQTRLGTHEKRPRQMRGRSVFERMRTNGYLPSPKISSRSSPTRAARA